MWLSGEGRFQAEGRAVNLRELKQKEHVWATRGKEVGLAGAVRVNRGGCREKKSARYGWCSGKVICHPSALSNSLNWPGSSYMLFTPRF